MALHKTSVKIVSSKTNLPCDITCYNFRSIGKKVNVPYLNMKTYCNMDEKITNTVINNVH